MIFDTFLNEIYDNQNKLKVCSKIFIFGKKAESRFHIIKIKTYLSRLTEIARLEDRQHKNIKNEKKFAKLAHEIYNYAQSDLRHLSNSANFIKILIDSIKLFYESVPTYLDGYRETMKLYPIQELNILYKQRYQKQDEIQVAIPELRKPEFDYMVRLEMIGDSGVGKTSIIDRFITDTFSKSYRYKTINDYKYKNVEVGGSVIKLKICEDFHHSLGNYNGSPQGIIVVCNLSDKGSIINVKNWVNSATIKYPDIKNIMLIGNKYDLLGSADLFLDSFHEVRQELQLCHSEFMLTSAMSGYHIDEAFTTFANHLYTNIIIPTMVQTKDESEMNQDIKRKRNICTIL